VKIQGIFISEEDCAQLKAHKIPVIGKEFPSTILVVNLTEDDPPSLPSLDLKFPSPSYSPTLANSSLACNSFSLFFPF